MKTPITMDDIAQRTGFNQSTVSRALRDDSLVATSTRKAIQQIAREMGYEPNPFAQAMNVLRRAKRPAAWRGTLALLISSQFIRPTEGLLKHAAEHANTLGYNLEKIHFHAPGMTSRRLTQILKTRNISGLLVLPDQVSTRMLKRLRLDWSQFSAVTLGNALLWPPIHRVSDNHFANAKNLVRKMASLGYRRIGLCIQQKMATIHADGGWEGGYSVGTQRLKFSIPPFFYEDGLHPDHAPAIFQWIRQERLDAILTDSIGIARYLIGKKVIAVPENLGIASLMSSPETPISGIDPQYHQVWATAVEYLVSLIHLNQRGIPKFPQRILLEGTWHPGSTVRKPANASELAVSTGSSPH